jgi:hypothetical protein
LCKLQREKELHQESFIHLTFEKVFDNKAQIEFIPFIFQVKNDLRSNNLLLLDIERMRVAHQVCVNSNLEVRKFIKTSKAGFVDYTLTRTSDVYEQKSSFFTTHDHSTQAINQLAKYAVTAQYNVLQRTDLSEEEWELQV